MFIYITILTPPLNQNPFPKRHEIYSFGRGFAGLHNYEFFLEMCGSRKKIFKVKYISKNRRHIDSILPSDNLPCSFHDEVKIDSG